MNFNIFSQQSEDFHNRQNESHFRQLPISFSISQPKKQNKIALYDENLNKFKLFNLFNDKDVFDKVPKQLKRSSRDNDCQSTESVIVMESKRQLGIQIKDLKRYKNKKYIDYKKELNKRLKNRDDKNELQILKLTKLKFNKIIVSRIILRLSIARYILYEQNNK